LSGERNAARHYGRVGLFMTAAAAIIACEPATDPLPISQRQLLVQAVLDLGSRSQMISVRWTGPTVSFFDEPAKGATVSITGPDGVEMIAIEDTIDLTAPRRGNYRLDLDSYGATVVPGAMYALRVTTTTGEVASGTTIVPAANTGLNDPGNVLPFRRSRDTLRLAWPRVPGAKSYFVTIRGQRHIGFSARSERYSTFADTTLTVAGDAEWFGSDPVFIPQDSVTVLVAAVDDNYYTFYHTIVDPFAGAPPTRLTGAIGVFGSLVPLITQRYKVTN